MNSEDLTKMTLDERFDNYLAACAGNNTHYSAEEIVQIKNIWVAGYAAGVARVFELPEVPDTLIELRDRVGSELADYMECGMGDDLDPKSIEGESQEKKGSEG